MTKNSDVNKVKENIAKTFMAMVADDEVLVEFSEMVADDFGLWNQNLVTGRKITLPQINNDSYETNRAGADLAACYYLFHNAEIHLRKSFELEEQNLFDAFEKVRVLLNVEDCYLGALKNILQAVEKSDFYALPLILLKGFDKFGATIKNRIINLENNLDKKILKKVNNLVAKIHNQNEFALGVEEIIELLREKRHIASDTDAPKDNEVATMPENLNEENVEKEVNKEFGEEEVEKEAIEKEEKITDLEDEKIDAKAQVRLLKSEIIEEKIKFENSYKIYSTKFDEVIFPQKLISKNELGMLRDQLELKIAKLDKISKKMTLKLKKKLLSKKNSFLEYDANSGVLDRKKFTKIVTDPLIDNVYLENKVHEYQDTALTILLDNSGSMRGNPIVVSALACEIIAEILEKFSIKTEIIGFTTADWRGGRVRKLWESNNKPKNPGRLNELRHIIYKSFNQNFKRAKINLSLMLKEGILKENIDGEALLFARSRLMQQSAKRKILMVISDGTPVDDSTISANDNDILSKHLEHVINRIEKQSKIEIVAIGIGHKIDEFYHNSISIKSLEELGDAMIEKIVGLL